MLEVFPLVVFFADTRSFFAGVILETMLPAFFAFGKVNVGSQRFTPDLALGMEVCSGAGSAGTSTTLVFGLKALITSNEPKAANPYWISPCQSGLVLDRKNRSMPRKPADRI